MKCHLEKEGSAIPLFFTFSLYTKSLLLVLYVHMMWDEDMAMTAAMAFE